MIPTWLLAFFLFAFSLLASDAQAARLSGVVLTESGEPLPSVVVAAYDQHLQYTAVQADADGTYVVAGLAAGTYRVLAWPAQDQNRVPGFHPDAATFCEGTALVLEADSDVGDVDIELVEGAVLSGVLLDQGGDPVAGAELRASDTVGEAMSRTAISEADGAFALMGLATTGDPFWTVSVEAEGWPDQYLGATYDSDDATPFSIDGPERETGAHALLDGVVLAGVVEGPDGAVAGTTVYAYSGGQILSVSTDADGRYEAVGLAPGSALAWTRPEGLAATYYPDADRPGDVETVAEGESFEALNLYPPVEAVLNLSLKSALDGEAVGEITGLLYNDSYTVGRGDAADADGNFTIDGLHGGTYFLYLWGARAGHADGWVVGDDGEPLPILLDDQESSAREPVYLEPAATLSGTVTDGQGQALRGVTVVASDALGQGDQDATDEYGSWQIGGLPAGEYTIQASWSALCSGDPGYVTVYFPAQVNPDWSVAVPVEPGGAQEDLHFELPTDLDHDQMGDTWEAGYGLDTTRDDSSEDPDDDGYSNLEEYRLGTDPRGAMRVHSGCGCASGAPRGGVPLILAALLLWGPLWGLAWGRLRRRAGQA